MARHPIADLLGLAGAALMLALPLAVGGPGSAPTTLYWLALTGAALVLAAPLAASTDGAAPPLPRPPTRRTHARPLARTRAGRARCTAAPARRPRRKVCV